MIRDLIGRRCGDPRRREDGARVVRLLVIDANHAARRCYERNGFRQTGRRFVRDRDGAAELEMEVR